jgi:hypothetical protein
VREVDFETIHDEEEKRSERREVGYCVYMLLCYAVLILFYSILLHSAPTLGGATNRIEMGWDGMDGMGDTLHWIGFL